MNDFTISLWHKRKAKDKEKPITQLSVRDQRHKQKYWREKQRERRQKLKAAKELQKKDEQAASKKKHQRERQRKKNKKIQDLETALSKAEQKLRKYKKRMQRLKKKLKKKQGSTPRKETRNLLGATRVSDRVKRTLVFHHALIQGLKEKCKKSTKAKKEIRNILLQKILKNMKSSLLLL